MRVILAATLCALFVTLTIGCKTVDKAAPAAPAQPAAAPAAEEAPAETPEAPEAPAEPEKAPEAPQGK